MILPQSVPPDVPAGRLLPLALPRYASALPPQYALVDEADYARLAARRWRYQDGHAVARGGLRPVPMHRFLLDALPGTVVSHRNGDALDNRRDNLVLSTDATARIVRSPAAIRALLREGQVYRVRNGPFAFVRLISRERYVALVEYARSAGDEAALPHLVPDAPSGRGHV
jgi:hypothetical protein